MQYYAPLVMEAGDSVYFDAATPHAVIAVGNGEATLLTIVSLAGHGHREGTILPPEAHGTYEATSWLPFPTPSASASPPPIRSTRPARTNSPRTIPAPEGCTRTTGRSTTRTTNIGKP